MYLLTASLNAPPALRTSPSASAWLRVRNFAGIASLRDGLVNGLHRQHPRNLSELIHQVGALGWIQQAILDPCLEIPHGSLDVPDRRLSIRRGVGQFIERRLHFGLRIVYLVGQRRPRIALANPLQLIDRVLGRLRRSQNGPRQASGSRIGVHTLIKGPPLKRVIPNGQVEERSGAGAYRKSASIHLALKAVHPDYVRPRDRIRVGSKCLPALTHFFFFFFAFFLD